MQRQVHAALLALVLLCIAVGSASGSVYVFSDLGLPAGAVSGYASGMSSDGRIVGQAWTLAPTPEMPNNGSWRSYVWADGVFTLLGTLEGDADHYAVAVNSSGQAVGSSYTQRETHETYEEWSYRACLWQDGVATALPEPAGACASGALDINDQGLIVGAYVVRDEYGWETPHACYWQPQADGSYLTAQPLPEGPALASSAGGVNELGQIAGYLFGPEGDQACRWDSPTAAPAALGPPPETEYFYVGRLWINNSGLIAGNSWFGPDTDMPHALVWLDGVMTMLPGVGGPQWEAKGINDAGLIAGTVRLGEAGGYACHACVWDGTDPTAVPIDLAAAAGVASCWASGISTAGDIAGDLNVPPDVHNEYEHSHWCLWQPITLSYTGDSLAPAGAVSLRAQLHPQGAAASQVTFTLATGIASPIVRTATVGADGSASVSLELAAGVYDVVAAATVNETPVETTALLVVYDPSGGFVTGHGSIDSPAGALAADPTLTGKAAFGFQSKYQKGRTQPVGNTRFEFKVADLTFHSDAYDWLVVAGARAQYKGTGAINGAGSYAFILTAVDGDVNGGGGVDKFRIKIWDPATDAVVYDNQTGDADSAGVTTALATGNVMIHK